MRDELTAPNGLVTLLDRLLDTGVTVAGRVRLALADIDLVDLDLRLLLTGVESARRRAGLSSGLGSAPGPRTPADRIAHPVPPLPPAMVLPERLDAERRGEDGVARLVLVLVELLREVLAAQAVARLEGGSLTDDEVERLGRALMLLELRCDALRDFLATDDSWRPFGFIDGSPQP